jgi:hypothetical protein
MPEALVAEITANRGELSWRDRLRDRLRQRVRQFSDGGALGSAAFVAGIKAQFRPADGVGSRSEEVRDCLATSSVAATSSLDDALSAIDAVTLRRLRDEVVTAE